MNTQMMICMVIFAATLVSYMMNKIPMWLTAMLSLTALYFTGCIDATGALAGFSNANTLLMATMFSIFLFCPQSLLSFTVKNPNISPVYFVSFLS